MNNPKFDGLDDTLARAEKAERECDTLRSEVERFRECLMQTQTDRDAKQAEVERLNKDYASQTAIYWHAVNERDDLRTIVAELKDTVAAQAAVLRPVDVGKLRDAAEEALGVLVWAEGYMEISSDIRQTEEVIAKLASALNAAGAKD